MSNILVKWLVACIVIFGAVVYLSEGSLITTDIQYICGNRGSHVIDLQYDPTGILKSRKWPLDYDFECTVTLQPRNGRGVVLSIYEYDLSPGDMLTIDDSDGHKIALVGKGLFTDERKSIFSNGRMAIHYRRGNVTYGGFQFTFTQVKNSPCSMDEFSCKNDKCIPKELVCDRHNHCGDRSDQQKCAIPEDNVDRASQSSATHIWLITVVISSVVLFIIIVVFVVVLVRRCRQNKTPPQSSQPVGQSLPLQSVSSNVPQGPVVHDIQRQSMFNRVRDSLRGKPKTEVQVPKQPETFQVPSMYPSLEQLPSAPEMHGVVNPDFKRDE